MLLSRSALLAALAATALATTAGAPASAGVGNVCRLNAAPSGTSDTCSLLVSTGGLVVVATSGAVRVAAACAVGSAGTGPSSTTLFVVAPGSPDTSCTLTITAAVTPTTAVGVIL